MQLTIYPSVMRALRPSIWIVITLVVTSAVMALPPPPDNTTKGPCHESLLALPRPIPIGAFEPWCEKDGYYSPQQVHGSTGQSWCVTREGKEIEGTRTLPGQPKYDCNKDNPPKGPCHEALLALPRPIPIGAFEPRCEEDGYYSPQQVHGSTGQSWCVTREGKEIEKTRTLPGQPKYDCNKVTKPGKCPRFLTPVPMVKCMKPVNKCHNDRDCPGSLKCCRNHFCGGLLCARPMPVTKPGKCPKYEIPLPLHPCDLLPGICRDDSDCPGKEKCCCRVWCGQRVCRPPVQANKPGQCPPMPIRSLSGLVPEAKCPPRCKDDTDCPGKKKCCLMLSLCGRVCRDPISPVTKPGKCRRLAKSRGRQFCPRRPVDKCRHDGDCPGKEKCCHRMRCGGLECVPPGEIDICELPVLPGQCEGSFPRWFYNAKTKKCEKFVYGGCGGNENRFKSQVHCEKKCKPLVCSPIKCLTLMRCEYGFQLDSNGCPICKCLLPCQDVKCKSDEKCIVLNERPPVGKCAKRIKPGTCPVLANPPPVRCAKPRHKCDDDSDCPGRKKCCVSICLARTCVNPAVDKKVCSLPARGGPCFPQLMRWYYNKRRNVCKKFRRGCGRNGNRFANQQACEALCRQPVCPPFECKLICKHGFALGENGCPMCVCGSQLCADKYCRPGTRCVLIQPMCVGCAPIPTCVGVRKPGHCPATTKPSPVPCTKPTQHKCIIDADCAGEKKCCLGPCLTYICMESQPQA